MERLIEKQFRAPYAMPNGLQVVGPTRRSSESEGAGLWIADQITDRVALVPLEAAPDAEYGVPRLVREVATESSNTSGLTFGEGSLWLAANGSAKRWRAPRPTDAADGAGEVLRVDLETGRTVARHPVPGGGGVHGIDYDRFEEGALWVTTLKSQTLSLVRTADWSVRRAIPLAYGHAHGVVRVEDGLWVVHKTDWLIVKLHPRDGSVLDRIDVPRHHPEVHCLSAWGNDLLYCDATTGWVVKITL